MSVVLVHGNPESACTGEGAETVGAPPLASSLDPPDLVIHRGELPLHRVSGRVGLQVGSGDASHLRLHL